MARPTLNGHRKFIRLKRALGSAIVARGCLELLWDGCYESGDDYVGTSDDLEDRVGWSGEKGMLTAALLNCGQPESQHGFIELVDGPTPGYRVHDLMHHAPEYVTTRRSKEAERKREKTCGRCGSPFFAADSRATFCSAACRQGNYRDNRNGVLPIVTDGDSHVTESDGTPAPAPALAPAPKTDRVPVGSGNGHSSLSARFERFWSAYPVKKAKDAALKAWQRRAPDEALTAVMLAAIERQQHSRAWREGFIKHPATWLNQGCWQDEPEPVKGSTAVYRPKGCRHNPPCSSDAAHTTKYLEETDR